MTNASMPELKKVRMASVGVYTIASPRRLNDVFMMTGTPVRFPNLSMRRRFRLNKSVQVNARLAVGREPHHFRSPSRTKHDDESCICE
jgi:hypothetical protein